MAALIVRRLIELPVVLLVVMILVFTALISTGDPVEMMVPPEATEADKQRVREAYGLDDPAIVQLGRFLLRAAQGDFGQSLYQRESALGLVLERVPATMTLALCSIVIAVSIGVPLGIVAGLKRGSIIDVLAMGVGVFGQTIASFWLAMILILVFSVRLQWLPVSGNQEGWRSVVLPAIALSVWLLGLLARMTRSGMLEIMGEDFIRTARAKGLRSRTVVIGHAMRHVLSPLVTITGLSLGWQLGGAVVIESVFAWQGVGTLMLSAVFQRDYPVVMAAVAFLAIVFVVLNLITDLLYPLIDPRVRTQGGA